MLVILKSNFSSRLSLKAQRERGGGGWGLIRQALGQEASRNELWFNASALQLQIRAGAGAPN